MKKLSTRALVLVGMAICLVLAGVASFYASGHPDGLEHVAEQVGFGSAARDSGAEGSPVSGYQVAGVSDARLAGGLAGVLGVLAVAVIAFALMRLLARRSSTDRSPGTP